MKFQVRQKKIALAQRQPVPVLGDEQPAAPARKSLNFQFLQKTGRFLKASPAFWALLGSLLLAAIYGRVAVFNLGYGVIGGDLDGYENLWNDSWIRTALFDLQRNPLFHTNYLYYPTGISLRYHTLNPLNGLFALPMWPLFGSVASTNLKFLLSMALTTFCAFLLIKDLTKNSLAAFTGAAIFTFANDLLIGNFIYGQAEKLSAWWYPLYLFCLFRAVNRPRWIQYGVGAWLCLLAMCLTDWQFVLYSVLMTLGYFVFMLATQRTWKEKGEIFLKLAAIGGSWAAVVIFPFVLPMIKEAAENPWLSVSEQAVSRSRALTQYIEIGTGNPGYLALFAGLAGLLLWWRKRPDHEERGTVFFWSVVALVATLLTFGPRLIIVPNTEPTGLPMLYALLYKLPVLNIGRDPERFYMTAMLGFSILLAFGLRELLCLLSDKAKSLEWQKPLAKALPLLAVGIFLAVSLAGFVAKAGEAEAYPPEWPPFYYTLAQDKEEYAIMELPLFAVNGEAGRGEDTYEAYQSIHGKPRMGGRLARDHKLTNPNNFSKNASIFRDFFWLNRQDKTEVYRPTKVADFLTPPDYKEWGLPLFNYYNIRYIIFYLEAFEKYQPDLKVAETLVRRLLGDNVQPVYQDNLMLAYRVPQALAPANKVFIDTGSTGWHAAEKTLEGTHRWADTCANPEAEKAQDLTQCGNEPAKLSLFNLDQTARPVKVSLTLFNYTQPRTINIDLNGATLQSLKLQPGETKDLTLEVNVPPGMSTLNLSSPEGPVGTGNKDDKRFLSFGVRAVKLIAG
jgi:hypothetical protein